MIITVKNPPLESGGFFYAPSKLISRILFLSPYAKASGDDFVLRQNQ